ncbi:hypothetical protein LQ318_01505 [Aliifodinibius salicampi]|uniref:DUF3784 domain-containing protein n=1 Tax=Fodinibius salicampi TaxID=1920655 RepID=A0ABT3PUN3_9BACT|nr:hypothetical protein [Fodinibius salicampi]MCW9711567.1 hypothetical protein [Fodinibius salicampi]
MAVIDFICSNIKATIISFGLLLDVIGVVITFRYGVPRFIDGMGIPIEDSDGSTYTVGMKNYGAKGYLGIILIVIGFTLQGIASWL